MNLLQPQLNSAPPQGDVTGQALAGRQHTQFVPSPFPHVSSRWRGAIAGLSLAVSVLLGVVDYFSGPDFSVGVLYIVPVAVATWYAGAGTGTIVSFVCAALWFHCVHLQMPWEIDHHPLIIFWNFVAGLLIFLAQVYTTDRLRRFLHRETAAARTDFLTGAANARSFYSIAREHVTTLRLHGRPCTFLYVDIDHFKQVNDRYGHPEGDRLLRVVADTMRRCLRAEDEMARLGGDEFAILLPGADAGEARQIAARLREALLQASRTAGWPVTFSIGMCTYREIPDDFQQIVHEADQLMYGVKQSGRDGIRHQIHAGPNQVQLSEPISGQGTACAQPEMTAPPVAAEAAHHDVH